jgi:hypothetical protein
LAAGALQHDPLSLDVAQQHDEALAAAAGVAQQPVSVGVGEQQQLLEVFFVMG